jgi:hypothetical protein
VFEYDATLKVLLKGSARVTIHALSGLSIARWHDVALSRVEEPRVDLLGEAGDGSLLHIELQSTNDSSMPLRMAAYGVKVAQIYGRYPKQVLLYVGEAPLRMAGEYRPNDDVSIRYKAVDARELDGERLLHSDGISDNVVAILAGLSNQRKAVRQIVSRIAALEEPGRWSALEQLLILAGLRHLGSLVKEEVKHMPITESILNHDVLGPILKEGGLRMLRRQIAKRFGAIPDWAEERLASMSASDLDELSERVLDASSLVELLK